ncbi:MAG TPA: glycosyltransferase family A protein [Rhodocyclaceae bacterium]|nr:glycosyltransferase family A protein [Rhodocyclaceae bacterium]
MVIRARNEQQALPATLAAIGSQRIGCPVEVVVVDSGSTDATLEIAHAAGARIVTIPRYRPGLASNAGLRVASHPVCVLLSAPAFPDGPEWLAALVRPLCEDPTVAASFGRQLPVPDAAPIEDTFLRRTFDETTSRAIFSATSAALRRAVWSEHPFDESIASGGPDDREWCARIMAAGYRVAYVGEALVRRSHGLSLGGWFYRLREDARVERTIVRKFGQPSSPTESAGALAAQTLAYLVHTRRIRTLVRYLLLVPVGSAARLAARRLGGSPGNPVRLVGALDALDRRLFRPSQVCDAATERFLSTYWATHPARPVRAAETDQAAAPSDIP